MRRTPEQFERCPECRADWSGGQTCTDDFHTMLFWELDDQLYDVHHLLVLCYNVQHPSIYSPETLRWAIDVLTEFVETDLSPQALRKRIQNSVDSSVRKHKITGTPEAHGSYVHPVVWTITVADVVADGVERYYASVRAWAKAILSSLRASGNFVQ